MQTEWLLVAVGYSIGSFPTALLVGRQAGHDPTSEGSRNPGASNVYRVVGRRAGALVLAGDLLKAIAATALGLLAGGRSLGVACGVASVVGHVLPVTRRFRGGKGVATAGGMGLVLYPGLAGALAASWVAVALATRRPSVASMAIMVAVVPGVLVLGRPAWELAAVVGVALLVLARHSSNLARLWRGDERALPPLHVEGRR